MEAYKEVDGIGYQCNTQNRSFAQYCLWLKQRGGQKFAYPLRLNNEKLVHMNPHGVLSCADKNRILIECIENPWYFFREICKIADPDNVVPFTAKRGIMDALYVTLELKSSVWLTGPRQITGKTTTLVALAAWYYMFSENSRNIIVLDTSKCRLDTFRAKMNNLIDIMPEYLVNGSIDDDRLWSDERDTWCLGDVEVFENRMNKNTLAFLHVSEKYLTADSIGLFVNTNLKKDTILVADDAETDYMVSELMTVLAKENKFVQTIFSSVPSKDRDLKSIYGEVLDMYVNRYHEGMLDAGNESSARNNLVPIYIEADYRTLGKSERWIEQQAKLFGADAKDIMKEDVYTTICSELLCMRDEITPQFTSAIKVKPYETTFEDTLNDPCLDTAILYWLKYKDVIDQLNTYAAYESRIYLAVKLDDTLRNGVYFALNEKGERIPGYVLPDVPYLCSVQGNSRILVDKYGRKYYIQESMPDRDGKK